MNNFRRFAALAGTAALAVATASAADATPNAKSSLPTWHVTITATGQQVTGTTYLEAGTVSRAGSVIGLDLLTCPGAAQEGVAVARCTVMFGFDGGTLTAPLSLDNATGAVSGRLAGGTGRFAHASGWITGQGYDGGADLNLTFAHHL